MQCGSSFGEATSLRNRVLLPRTAFCSHPRLLSCKLILHLVFDAVYADGGICLDILQNQWSPIYDVSAILTSIQVGTR